MRSIGRVVTILFGLGAVAGPLALRADAAKPQPVDVTFTVTSSTTVSVRTADGNTFLALDRTGVLNGTISGTTSDRVKLVVRLDGSTVVQGAGTCLCAVGDRTGTISYRIEGTGVFPASASGRWVMFAGRGGLADVHAEGSWTTSDFVHADLEGSLVVAPGGSS